MGRLAWLTHLKRPGVAGGLALVLLLLVVALWPEAIEVDAAVVRRAAFEQTVDEEAETRVRDRFVLSAPVAGRIVRIELEPGDRVGRGQALVTLRPESPALLDARSRAEAESAAEAARAALGRSQAEQARARAAQELAAAELKRARELSASGVISVELLDQRESQARSAEQALRAADYAAAAALYDLERARARLDPPGGAGGTAARNMVLRAPIDGVVLRRLRESESVVPPGDPLLELGDPRRLEIVSDLLSTDAVRVREGQRVRIERWGGETPLLARVRRVEPHGFTKISALGVEEQRVNAVMDFVDPVEAWKRLGDGYRVEVRIVVYEAPQALVAPAGALFRRSDGWAAFVVDGGRARLRPVEVGRRNGAEAELLSGLAEGERVIVHPSERLGDGSRLRVRQGS
jgi:HlyD family secretion protein